MDKIFSKELAENSQTGGESENEEERALAKVDELATELEMRIGNLEQKVANEKIAREWLNQFITQLSSNEIQIISGN